MCSGVFHDEGCGGVCFWFWFIFCIVSSSFSILVSAFCRRVCSVLTLLCMS